MNNNNFILFLSGPLHNKFLAVEIDKLGMPIIPEIKIGTARYVKTSLVLNEKIIWIYRYKN